MKNDLIESTERLFIAALETMKKKNADYAGDASSMKNFELSASVANIPMSKGIIKVAPVYQDDSDARYGLMQGNTALTPVLLNKYYEVIGMNKPMGITGNKPPENARYVYFIDINWKTITNFFKQAKEQMEEEK